MRILFVFLAYDRSKRGPGGPTSFALFPTILRIRLLHRSVTGTGENNQPLTCAVCAVRGFRLAGDASAVASDRQRARGGSHGDDAACKLLRQ